MAFFDTTWYLNSVGWTAVTAWATGTVYAAGALRRQNTTPTVGQERVFVCIVAGTSHATTEPTWVITRGGKTTDNTVTWQECTGASAVNGDLTNTPNWTTVKNAAVTLGQIIKRNNGASYQICTTAGTAGNGAEPAFSDTAGTTTADNTVTWTSLGVVGNFTGGQAPFARVVASFANTWFAEGNTTYIGDNHSESQTAQITVQPSLSATASSKILCHDHLGPYPPAAANLTTGAVIATDATGNGIFWGPSGVGTLYARGITLRTGVGAASGNITIGGGDCYIIFDNCTLELANSGGALINMGQGSALTIMLENTKLKFASVNQKISMAAGHFFWRNTGTILVTGSSVPTNFMLTNSAVVAMVMEALDLSQLSGTLFQTSAGTYGYYVVKDCKLHASVTFTNPAGPTQQFQFIRCDSAGVAYSSTRRTYEGTETTETTITRVGGSVDPTGQAQSRKIVTTANVQFPRPFRVQPMDTWNPTVAGNVTVTVRGTINSASLPNNDEIWMDVEYLGTSGSPLGITATTGKANVLSTAAAVASDGSTWNGGGSGAGWSPFKLTVTLSAPQPQFAGYLTVRVKAAKVSTTYYIDPLITLT